MGVASCFHWFDKSQLVRWFEGREAKRHRRIEKILRRLSVGKRLRTVKYGNKLVYALPRKTRKKSELENMSKIAHGLMCSEALVRFFRSKMEVEIIPERWFRGLGCVPEWGLRYSNGSLLLFEYCSKSNFLYHENMNGKINAYLQHIEGIEEHFETTAVVLFVIDAPRDTVRRFAKTVEAGQYFFFCNLSDFLRVPLGKQLQSPIYIWTDGKEWPLSD
jgi:hypothetical protein